MVNPDFFQFHWSTLDWLILWIFKLLINFFFFLFFFCSCGKVSLSSFQRKWQQQQVNLKSVESSIDFWRHFSAVFPRFNFLIFLILFTVHSLSELQRGDRGRRRGAALWIWTPQLALCRRRLVQRRWSHLSACGAAGRRGQAICGRKWRKRKWWWWWRNWWRTRVCW